jgi:putative drug exporter of the RND superfamily
VFDRLAPLIVRRRRLVALIWLVALSAGAIFGGKVFDHLGETEGLRPDAESVVAEHRIEQLVPEGQLVIAVIDGRFVYDPELVADVTRVVGQLQSMDGVLDVDSIYTSPGGGIASDNQATLATVELRDGLPEDEQYALQDRVVAALESIDAPRVLVGGPDLAERAFVEQSVRDLARGETVAFSVLLVLLLLVFGGLVAAGLPLLVALVSVSVTLLALLGLGHVVPVSEYSVNIVTFLGIGLAVDYSLLLVARFREERAGGLEVPDAAARSLVTAGRTVAFSGLTVSIALAGMLVFAEPLLRSMALAGVVVVLLVAAAAVTLVPALLAMWGRRIRPARARPDDHGLLYRLSRVAQARAGLVAVVVAGALVLVATPFLGANLEDAGVESLPRSSEARQVDDQVRTRFGGTIEPISVVVGVDDGSPDYLDFLNRAAGLEGVRAVDNRPDVPDGQAIVDVLPEGRASGPTATRLVSELRAIPTPFAKQVTGPAAKVVDYRRSVGARLPIALGVIVLATLVLLFAMTGSVVVPLKALVMNVLSLGASLGIVVWIFQDGHLSWLLDFDPAGSIDLTTPLLVVVFAFGLSMDYEVFLLARIKEIWDRTGDNDRAVAVGLARSGRVVTAAAACIVVVFLGFAAGRLLPLKALGVGMTVAIVLDVTIVRGLLLPAVMTLLGDRNWWAPPALARLYARLHLHDDAGGEDRPLVGAAK